MNFFSRFRKSLLVVVLLLFAIPAYSQVNWWRFDDQPAITLELHKVDYNTRGGSEFFGLLNMVGFLGAQVRLSPRVSLLAELPFSSFDVSNSYQIFNLRIEDEYAVGNPFIGLKVSDPSSRAFFQGGIRLPLANEDKYLALGTGMYGAYDRFEAFVPKLWTATAQAGLRTRPRERGLTAYVLVGPTYMISDEGDAELFLDYTGFLGGQTKDARYGMMLHGKYLVSESDIDLSDRVVHEFGVMGALRYRTVEPGIHFKISLDSDVREWAQFTYGLNLLINLQPASAN